MKRLVLSFAILLAAAACGSDGETGGVDNQGAKPGKPREGKPQLDGGSDEDAGASADAGGASDSGSTPGDAGAGQDSGAPRPDSSAPADAGNASADTGTGGSTAFDGRWDVTLSANENTTCTRPGSFEPRIVDTWQIQGAVLTGNHLGPNPYEREPGADVWSAGAASIDLTLNGAVLGGTVYFDYGCDVFYDVTGERAK